MGHFHNPPPGPIAGATAAQPYHARQKFTPGIPVNNPPFSNRSRTPQIIAENAAIAQPDPWSYAFESGNGAQPYVGSKLPPSLIIVPNPPFINANKSPTTIWQMAVWAQPDPWVYAFQEASAGQPYAGGKLSDGIPGLSVDNPPRRGISQSPYPLDAPPLPQQARYVPQVAVVVSVPFVNAWLSAVLQSWIPGDPLPTLPRNLNPFFTAVRVDNPPGIVWRQTSYPADPFILPQQLVLMPQGATTAVAQTPFVLSWLSGVLASWQPGDPLPTLPRNLNPFFTAVQVDNPPFSSRTQIPGIVLSWQPPDPLPTLQGKLSPGIPGQSVDNPPGLLARQIPYPPDAFVLPQQLVLIPQAAAAAAVQNPFVLSWLSGVLQSWQPGDPPVQLPRNLSPFFLGVQTDNPPFSYGGRNVWAADLASRAWQPPDPLPTLSGKLSPTIIAVRVDNPPFSSRSELANILGQWQFPPPLPTPSFPPLQPQGGTTPPPPVFIAQFTVSGSDVSVHFAEFFSDVVFTDAPITKRTN